jgi:uncharacterized delta-60 repeat protein
MATFEANSGWVISELGSTAAGAEDLLLQTDGKILLAGFSTLSGKTGFALARHNADGSADTEFGDAGVQTTLFTGSQATAYAAVLQSDGKVVLAGEIVTGSQYAFGLARYNTDGSLDTGFSDDGKLTTDFGAKHGVAYTLAVQSDGKLLVAGDLWSGSEHDFGVVRYNADGSLDNSFSSDGVVSTDFGGYDAATSIVVQSDGKILVAGSSKNGTHWDFALARYNSDGSLDTSFGSNGRLTTDIGTEGGFGSGGQKNSHDYAADMKISATGKIYVAGSSSLGSGYDFALARYSADGVLEGVLTTDFGANDYGSSLVLQTDGQMLIAGKTHTGSKSDMAAARYNALDGSLDTSFDGDGKLTTDIGGKGDEANAVVLQSDGTFLLAGKADTGTHFVLAAYNADGSLAATNEKSGTARSDKLVGNGAADWMLGLAGNDSLTGAAGNDTLDGGDGKDTLSAGEGDDDLKGGAGADKLTGGGGADRIFLDRLEKKAFDTITDFAEADTLVFDTSVFTALATVTADNFVLGSKAQGAEDFLIFNTVTGKLYYDADGSNSDSVAVQIAGIKGSGAQTLSFDDMSFGDVFAL